MASGWGGSDTHLHCLDVATLDNIDLQRYGGRHLRRLLFNNNVQNESKLSYLLDLRACGHHYFMRGGVLNSTRPQHRTWTSQPRHAVHRNEMSTSSWRACTGGGQRTLPHITLARLHTFATLDLDRLPFKQLITSGIAAQQTKRQRSPGRLGVLMSFLELHNSS